MGTVIITRSITRNKKEHFLMIKGSIYQENIKILISYASNGKGSKCTEQNFTKL